MELKSVGAALVVLAAVGPVAGPALAQEQAQDGFYLRAGAGASFASTLDQQFAYNPDLVFAGTPPSGQAVETDTGFLASFAAGFDYADGIRTELEYRYATNGVASVTPVGGVPNPPERSSGENLRGHFVFSNFYYDFRNSSRVTPFIGLGVGGAFVDVEGGERDAALAYQGRAGLSLGLNGGFSADVEYVYARSNTLRYGPANEDFTPAGPFEPAVDGDQYEASSVLISLRKQF